MSRGLIVRIFDRLFADGLLKAGDVCVDPFGGIGTTGIESASRGIRFVGCELESKFVRLATSHECCGFTKADWRRYARRWSRHPNREAQCPTCQQEPGVERRGVVPCAAAHLFVGNFERHRRDWSDMGRPLPVIVQGDSRRLREVLRLAGVKALVSSPPYVETINSKDHGIDWSKVGPATGGRKRGEECKHGQTLRDQLAYGETPGQLGAMASGDVDAVIASPPYAEIASGSGGLNTTAPKHAGQQGGRSASSASQDTDSRYGEAEGQLARMALGDIDVIVSSPPFSSGDSASAQSMVNRTDKSALWVKANAGSAATQGYGTAEGQLGTMATGDVADALVSSPPWEAGAEGGLRAGKFKDPAAFAEEMAARGGKGTSHAASPEARQAQMARDAGKTDGESEGQLGQETGETFWSAAKQIIAESHAILRDGGTAVWVLKSFVRKGKIVDFPGDWRRLCEHLGFETFLEVHASLVSETTHGDLFDGSTTKKRERKSFFRRLAEAKGSPKIDYEVVLFMRKGPR